MIVDAHAHLSGSDFGNVDVLLRQMDQAGIDRAVCVPGGMIDVRQFSRIFSGQLTPDRNIPNHFVYDAIAAHPDRLFGFVCLDPTLPDEARSMLREGFERGCRGVKLAPIVHRFAFDAEVLAEVAETCGSHGVPVYSHVLSQPGSTTHDFADFAGRHPQTTFILGHMGFGPGDIDAIARAAEMENLCLETSLGNFLILEEALQTLGPEKLIFGSEFPLSHPKVELEKVLLLGKQAHNAILQANILRLIGAA